MDCVFEDLTTSSSTSEKEVVIVDYKFSEPTKNKEKNKSPPTRSFAKALLLTEGKESNYFWHCLQLMIYQVLFQIMHPKIKVKGLYLCYFDPDRAQLFDLKHVVYKPQMMKFLQYARLMELAELAKQDDKQLVTLAYKVAANMQEGRKVDLKAIRAEICTFHPSFSRPREFSQTVLKDIAAAEIEWWKAQAATGTNAFKNAENEEATQRLKKLKRDMKRLKLGVKDLEEEEEEEEEADHLSVESFNEGAEEEEQKPEPASSASSAKTNKRKQR